MSRYLYLLQIILHFILLLWATANPILLCRYATIYTMFPVFSLVLDEDVKPDMALLYPELYKDLTKVDFFFCFFLCVFDQAKWLEHWTACCVDVAHCWSNELILFIQGRSLSFKTFLIWVLISVYQGKAHLKSSIQLSVCTVVPLNAADLNSM